MSFKDLAAEIGELVDSKNAAYGNSHEKCGVFFRLLWPDGIPPDRYEDALTLVRMFDKQLRIATDPHYGGEDPWHDLMGYSMLGCKRARDRQLVKPFNATDDVQRMINLLAEEEP